MSSTGPVTHLKLTQGERQLANMRAAMLRLNLSEYIGQLVRADAQLCGLAELLESDAEKEVGHE